MNKKKNTTKKRNIAQLIKRIMLIFLEGGTCNLNQKFERKNKIKGIDESM